MNDSATTFQDVGITIPPGRTGEITVTCPQCSATRKPEHRTSKILSVNVEKGVWFCNHCGWKGGLLSKKDQASLQYQFMVDPPKYPIVKETSKEAEWFVKRGISYPTVLKNLIRSATVSMYEKQSNSFKEKNTVVFESRRYGILVNRKFRDGWKNFKLEKNADLVFWGLDHAIQYSDNKTLVITEGEIDKMSYNEVDIWNVASVPNGATISKDEKAYFDIHGELPSTSKVINLEYLDKEIDYILSKYTDFIIATDNDAAGFKLRKEFLRRLGMDKCKVIEWKQFPGCKDANDILLKFGTEGVKLSYSSAKFLTPEWVITARQTWTELDNEYDHGKDKGKSTSYPNLDLHFKLRPGDTIALNGYPSHGKTIFAFNLVIASALLHNWKWAIYSPENMPAKRIIDTLAQILVGNTSDSAQPGRMSKSEFYEAVNDFLETHIYIIKGRFNPKELREKQRHMVLVYGIHGFLKDPWNSLKHIMKSGQTLDTYLEDELSEEVNFALENTIINLINVHPPTPKDYSEKSVPSPFSITGGKIWYAKLQAILCVHRPTKSMNGEEVDIHVQKIKEQDLVGIPTAIDSPVKMIYNRRSKRFLIEGKNSKGDLIRYSPITVLYEEYHKSKNLEFTF